MKHNPLLDNRYLLLELLGEGGMGRVYRAFDRVEERMVALKVVHESRRYGAGHPLAEEYRVWSRLNHPNIVRAYELGRARCGPLTPETPYLVLESFSGRPAQHALSAGRVRERALEAFARRVLLGLSHVHDAGLVHRDLKPSNVLVRRADSHAPGCIKLTDFGLATPMGRTGVPGRVSGSLLFVAPESVLGRPVDARTDLYGLGLLLYFLATGRMPMQGEDAARVLHWHVRGPAADPRRHRADLSPRLARFILRLTEREPRGRPASCDEALQLLGRAAPLTPRRAPESDDGDLVRLRLALDATRLGARRRLTLPDDRGRARILVREAATLSDLHGLTFARLELGSESARAALTRLVLRLLLERGDPVGPLLSKHRLRDGLPLGLFGGLPVWERMGRAGRLDAVASRATARGVAAFLLEYSGRRPLVLAIEPAPRRDRLVSSVVLQLARYTHVDGGSPAGEGGLLVMLPEELTVKQSTRRPARRSDRVLRRRWRRRAAAG